MGGVRRTRTAGAPTRRGPNRVRVRGWPGLAARPLRGDPVLHGTCHQSHGVRRCVRTIPGPGLRHDRDRDAARSCPRDRQDGHDGQVAGHGDGNAVLRPRQGRARRSAQAAEDMSPRTAMSAGHTTFASPTTPESPISCGVPTSRTRRAPARSLSKRCAPCCGTSRSSRSRNCVAVRAASIHGFDLQRLQLIADQIGPTMEQLKTPLATEDRPRYPEETCCSVFRWAGRELGHEELRESLLRGSCGSADCSSALPLGRAVVAEHTRALFPSELR